MKRRRPLKYDGTNHYEVLMDAIDRFPKKPKRERIKFWANVGLMTRKGNLTEWGKTVSWLLHAGQQKDPRMGIDQD